jgi:hypothetical protein
LGARRRQDDRCHQCQEQTKHTEFVISIALSLQRNIG